MTALGACYKQLNASVGEFGTATLQAATAAIESSSSGDATYLSTDRALSPNALVWPEVHELTAVAEAAA